MRAALKSRAFMAAVAVTVPSIFLAPQANAVPQVTGCGGNEFVEGIDLYPVDNNKFRIELTPTQKARMSPSNRDVTVSMWHQIQSCVPGLYGALADSIWQQLECHQMIPIEAVDFRIATGDGTYEIFRRELTGPTYGLESVHERITNPNPINYILTKCLNGTGYGIVGRDNGDGLGGGGSW